MPKKIFGYFLILFSVLILIGNIVMLYRIIESANKETAYMAGQAVAMIALLYVAYLLFKYGRKLCKINKFKTGQVNDQ